MRLSLVLSLGIRPVDHIRCDSDFPGGLEVGSRPTKTGECVYSINVHGAATTDTFSTTPPKCQGGINLVLDSDQGIQHHGTGLVQVQGVALHARLGRWFIRVPAVDVEGLDLGILSCGGICDGRGLSSRDGISAGRGVDAGQVACKAGI